MSRNIKNVMSAISTMAFGLVIIGTVVGVFFLGMDPALAIIILIGSSLLDIPYCGC